MWKWFKRLIVLVIVLFFAMVALLIPDKIDSQDQLKNVSTQTSLVDLVQAGIGGTSLSSGDLSTEINLDSNQFRQVLKASIAESNDETLQNSTVELNDSYLTAKVPVSLGPIESTFSLDFTVSTNKEVWFCLTSRRALPSPAVVFAWLTTRFSSSFLKSATKLSKPLLTIARWRWSLTFRFPCQQVGNLNSFVQKWNPRPSPSWLGFLHEQSR